MANELTRTEIKRRLRLVDRYINGRIGIDDLIAAFGNMTRRRVDSWIRVGEQAKKRDINRLLNGKVSFHALTAELGIDGPVHSEKYGDVMERKAERSRKKNGLPKRKKIPRRTEKKAPVAALDPRDSGVIIAPEHLGVYQQPKISVEKIDRRIAAIEKYLAGDIDIDQCVEGTDLSPHHTLEWIAMIGDAPKELVQRLRDRTLTATNLMMALGIRGQGKGGWKVRLHRWIKEGRFGKGSHLRGRRAPTAPEEPEKLSDIEMVQRAIGKTGLKEGEYIFSHGNRHIQLEIKRWNRNDTRIKYNIITTEPL